MPGDRTLLSWRAETLLEAVKERPSLLRDAVDACCAAATAAPDLEEAMDSNESDGVADEIRIAAGTLTESAAYEPEPGSSSNESFEAHGSDALTIVKGSPRAILFQLK